VKVIHSTATVIPTPKYPTPVKEYSSAVGTGTAAGVGTGVPSGFTYKPEGYNAPTSVVGGVYTPPPGAVASGLPAFESANAGGKMGFSAFSGVVVVMVMLVLGMVV